MPGLKFGLIEKNKPGSDSSRLRHAAHDSDALALLTHGMLVALGRFSVETDSICRDILVSWESCRVALRSSNFWGWAERIRC